MFEDIVERIYEAAFVPDNWPGILDRLCEQSHSASSTMVIFRGDEQPQFKATAMITDSVQEFMASGDWRKSPQTVSVFTPVMLELTCRFMTGEEFLTKDEWENDPIRRHLRKHNLGSQLGTAVALAPRESVVFTFERLLKDGPHSQEQIDTLGLFRPHLARASLVAARLRLERAFSSVAVMEKLGLPAAVLASDGRVLAANALLERLPTVFLARAGGGLALPTAEADALLRLATAQYAKADATVRSIPVPAAEGRAPMVIHVLPLRRSAHDIFSGGDVLIAATTAIAAARTPSPGILTALFDLAPAEARLAAALATGKTLRAIAEQQGIQVSSARTYLAHIFRKTGTHQQSELVALLKSTQPIPED